MGQKDKRRVVVTGIGVVSSIGIGKEDFWPRLISGTSGISKIESFDTSNYPSHFGGEIKNFQPERFVNKHKIKLLGRASLLSVAASRLAFEDARLSVDYVERHGGSVCVGTTMGETQLMEEMDSTWVKDGHEQVRFLSIASFIPAGKSVAIKLVYKLPGLRIT